MRTGVLSPPTSSTDGSVRTAERGSAVRSRPLLGGFDALCESESAAGGSTVSPSRRSPHKGSGRGCGPLVLALPFAEWTHRASPKRTRGEPTARVRSTHARDAQRLALDRDQGPAHLAVRIPDHNVTPVPGLPVSKRKIAELAQVSRRVELVAKMDDRPAEVRSVRFPHCTWDRRLQRPSRGNRWVIGPFLPSPRGTEPR